MNDKLQKAVKLFSQYSQAAAHYEFIGKRTLNEDHISKGLQYRRNATLMGQWLEKAVPAVAMPVQPVRKTWQGLKVKIENRAGSYRYWSDPDAQRSGATYMWYDYGEFKQGEGVDGDKVDCYFGNCPDAKYVYVVRQMKSPDFSVYDEDKCMCDFADIESARSAYRVQYDDKRFLGSIDAYLVDVFKAALKDTHKAPQPIGNWEAVKLPCRLEDVLDKVSIPDQLILTDEDRKRMSDELVEKYPVWVRDLSDLQGADL